MKKYTFIILFIGVATCFSQNNNYFDVNYRAIYSVNYQPDSTDVKSKINGLLFTLLIGKNESVYADKNKILLDSILIGVEKGKIRPDYVLSNLNSVPKPVSNAKIIKNKNENKIFYIDNISSQTYIYSEKLNLMKWNIKEDTASISNYKCQKAETFYAGRKYVAWFTTEIPFSDGPYKFNGLPGLIINLSDSKKHFEFTLIKFEKTDNLKMPTSIEKPVKISKRKYYMLRDSYFSNPIPFMESEGAVFDEENRKKIIEIFKKRKKQNNNPIELEY